MEANTPKTKGFDENPEQDDMDAYQNSKDDAEFEGKFP